MTVAEQVSRNVALRGKPLAVEVHGLKGFLTRAGDVLRNLPALLTAKDVEVKFFTPLGLEMNAAALIGKTAEEIDAAAVQIDVLSQATVARKSQIELREMIDDSRLPFKVAIDVLPGSLANGRAIAEERNKQDGGKRRIPTEPELLELNRLLGDQLKGSECWIWTETEHEDYPGRFVLRHRSYDYRFYFHPEFIFNYCAVRLVEDR
jgi:hypothetical protein